MLQQAGFSNVICIANAVKFGLIGVGGAGHRGAGDPVRNAVSLFFLLFIVGHAFKALAQLLYAFAFGVRALGAHGCAHAGITGGEHGQCHQADQQAGQ